MRPLLLFVGFLAVLTPALGSALSKYWESLVAWTGYKSQWKVFGPQGLTITKSASNRLLTFPEYIRHNAQSPDRVDVDALNKFFADPADPKLSEVATLAASDPKGADGKPLYNGKYNSKTMVGEVSIHTRAYRKIAIEYRKTWAYASTALTDSKILAEVDKLGSLHHEAWNGSQRSRRQDLENGAIKKANEALKPWGIEVKTKLIPGTNLRTIDWIDLFQQLRAKGGGIKDFKQIVHIVRSHRVVKTPGNDGKGHDDIARSMQASHSLVGSPEDGC